ncbi:MAG: undecaprenyl-diphosphate phosphatase [Verrucomicrobia bacterium]|nr:undecaprenyl-diphosphate phosphatase [Verrucomicrobiota bacterium]
MTTLLKAVLLGIIQGLTEFLPVSSSGHLVIFQDLFGFNEHSLMLDVFLHAGTLMPVFIVFRRDIAALFTTRRPWIWLIAAGTVPIVVVGALFYEPLTRAFASSRLVGALLLFNGAILLAGSRLGRTGATRSAGWLHAGAVGLAQAVAILPGISRSGSTISTGLATGLDREDAARFSFLLAIPAILLALAHDLWKAFNGAEPIGSGVWGPIAAGTVAAAIVGYGALRLLLAVVRRRKLAPFGWYCLAVGAAVLVFHCAH